MMDTELTELTKNFIKDLDIKKTTELHAGRLASRAGLVAFYKQQLKKFMKLGIGSRTENRVMISPQLINITIKRLSQLKVSKTDKKRLW